MKRTTLCFLIACFLIFSISATWAVDKVVVVPLDVKIQILSGQVKLTRVGNTKTYLINKSVKLYAGDLLETLRESKAKLVYTDGTVMKIKPRTLIEVQPMAIKLFKGKTWYKFTKRGTEFRIITPTLVAGIRGTQFEVAVTSRQKSFVSVTEGAVSVRSRAPGPGIIVKPGYSVACDVGEKLTPIFKFNAKKKDAEWNSAKWHAADGTTDINKLFIRYLNFKSEYGETDPKTLGALKDLEGAKRSK